MSKQNKKNVQSPPYLKIKAKGPQRGSEMCIDFAQMRESIIKIKINQVWVQNKEPCVTYKQNLSTWRGVNWYIWVTYNWNITAGIGSASLPFQEEAETKAKAFIVFFLFFPKNVCASIGGRNCTHINVTLRTIMYKQRQSSLKSFNPYNAGPFDSVWLSAKLVFLPKR